MKVTEIMSTEVVSVAMDDTLAVVKDIFDNASFHHILVVELGKLCGVISDRDLLKAISPNIDTVSETTKDSATLNKKAHQILTRQLITLTPSAGIYDAISVFNEYKISCIPIVDDENKPIGIISWRDVFMVIEERKNAKTQ